VSRELEFNLPGLRLAAVEHGDAGGHPVIALHGWLDNAGSFELLAPELRNCHLIALDAAGHGRSGHRGADSGYNIWQDVGDVLDVADQLGWERFSLLGHSRGGAIATLFAATFPDRTDRLLLIEGGLPMIGDASEAPENLASAIQQSRVLHGKTGRVFATREAAIAERVGGFTPVTEAAADVLAARSLAQVEGGWQWQADQRLKAGSDIKLTRELLEAFLLRVNVPAICILAEDSPFYRFETFQTMLPLISGIKIQKLPGRHHFHLEGAAAGIAELLNDFIDAR
jgi:pimeloyl-ACP methyl ester carboxylesterase